MPTGKTTRLGARVVTTRISKMKAAKIGVTTMSDQGRL
jgi:hypothetical protein